MFPVTSSSCTCALQRQFKWEIDIYIVKLKPYLEANIARWIRICNWLFRGRSAPHEGCAMVASVGTTRAIHGRRGLQGVRWTRLWDGSRRRRRAALCQTRVLLTATRTNLHHAWNSKRKSAYPLLLFQKANLYYDLLYPCWVWNSIISPVFLKRPYVFFFGLIHLISVISRRFLPFVAHLLPVNAGHTLSMCSCLCLLNSPWGLIGLAFL